MAKQTEIAYEPTKEWQDFQTGGTRIDAADLNNMEQGISDACAAVDELRTKRLPTYLVATGGDEATQDVYQGTILGPCLIVDLSTATTYYDNGEDGDGHERTKLTSGADIDDLRDSLSQTVRCSLLLGDISNVAPGGSISVPGLSGYDYALVMAYTGDYGIRSSVLTPTQNANAAFPSEAGTQGVNISGGTINGLDINTKNVFIYRVYGVVMP